MCDCPIALAKDDRIADLEMRLEQARALAETAQPGVPWEWQLDRPMAIVAHCLARGPHTAAQMAVSLDLGIPEARHTARDVAAIVERVARNLGDYGWLIAAGGEAGRSARLSDVHQVHPGLQNLFRAAVRGEGDISAQPLPARRIPPGTRAYQTMEGRE